MEVRERSGVKLIILNHHIPSLRGKQIRSWHFDDRRATLGGNRLLIMVDQMSQSQAPWTDKSIRNNSPPRQYITLPRRLKNFWRPSIWFDLIWFDLIRFNFKVICVICKKYFIHTLCVATLFFASVPHKTQPKTTTQNLPWWLDVQPWSGDINWCYNIDIIYNMTAHWWS